VGKNNPDSAESRGGCNDQSCRQTLRYQQYTTERCYTRRYQINQTPKCDDQARPGDGAKPFTGSQRNANRHNTELAANAVIANAVMAIAFKFMASIPGKSQCTLNIARAVKSH